MRPFSPAFEYDPMSRVSRAGDCAACPSRPSCTRAKDLPRALTLQPKEEHEAIQRARERQKTEEFASLYCARAGIEGTFSQGVRAFGLRKARRLPASAQKGCLREERPGTSSGWTSAQNRRAPSGLEGRQ